MKIDVVICSKDRPELLRKCTQQIFELIPYNKIFVYEGSVRKDVILETIAQEYNIKIVDVQGLQFGAVRNMAIINSNADYIAMIDDDIILTHDWFFKVMGMFKNENVAASQGRLIYGTNNIMTKISENALRDDGGSGGASIYDRKKILEIGNFNKKIHRGEDMELKLRMQCHGYVWAKNVNALSFHPVDTVKSFVNRSKADVVGWKFIMENSNNRTRFLIERFVSCLIMPIYYMWKTFDPRCGAIWALFRWKGMFQFLLNKGELIDCWKK